MKILITGLIAFLAWSAVSSYWYICKIKNLCPDEPVETVAEIREPEPVEPVEPEITADTTALPAEVEVVAPGKITLRCAFNRTDFLPSGDLGDYLNNLSEYLKANASKKVLITGHTDNIGSDGSNRLLGTWRAEYLQTYLIDSGVPAERISIESKGEEAPVADNNTEAGRAQNRRIEIAITE